MFLFLMVLLLTLTLHVFGTQILQFLYRLQIPVLDTLAGIVDFRFFLLLFLQTVLFTAMFMALPNRKNSFRSSLPGALLAQYH
jgi:membrane protein